MYNPPHFQEERPEVLQQLMREHSLAALVTLEAPFSAFSVAR